MKLSSLPHDILRAVPVLALVAFACTSGCAAPTDDDGETEAGAPNAPDDPNDDAGENTGTVESEIASCPNSGSGALLSAHRSGNFNWVTTLVDTRKDGKAPSVRVEIYDPGAHFGPATRVYTHRNTKGCTKSSTHSYHITPPVCVNGPSEESLRVRMWLYNGSTKVSFREVWTAIRCTD